MDIPPLREIDNIDDLLRYVDIIMDAVCIDTEYKRAMEKILRDVLLLMLGYECYYRDFERRRTKDLEDIPAWASVANRIEELTYRNELNVFIDKPKWPFESRSLIKRQIEDRATSIGGELFEDFDEEGRHEGFIQQIGGLGESAGYELMCIVPDKENSFMSLLYINLLALSEVVSEIDDKFDEYYKEVGLID